MKLKNMALVIAGALLGGGAVEWFASAQGENAAQPSDIELVLSDLHDLTIMRDMAAYRAALIARGTPPPRLNYSYYEDEMFAANEWPNVSGYILLHPTAESGLYAVYRYARYRGLKPDLKITEFDGNFLIALYGSAQHLALLEERDDIYRALVDAQA